MEYKERGIIERDINLKLQDNILESLIKQWKNLSELWMINSVKSAVIRHLYESIYDNFINIKAVSGTGPPSNEELNELLTLFTRRIPEIKSKIDIILNL